VRRGGAEARQRGRREERRSALAFSQNFTAGERRAGIAGWSASSGVQSEHVAGVSRSARVIDEP
jgi:hypothetical protein